MVQLQTTSGHLTKWDYIGMKCAIMLGRNKWKLQICLCDIPKIAA